MKNLLTLASLTLLLAACSTQPGTTGGYSSSAPSSAVSTNQTVSDGTITISYDPNTFALATTQDQVMVHSYIPPCDQGFSYCLYYNQATYSGSNFESAGLGITKRTDLTAQADCLNTAPAGYTSMTPSTHSENEYATSTFGPMGDAGAGHYANGTLYRLFANGTCEEFQTRIGETQYANYPAGTVTQFTDADRNAVNALLSAQLSNITLADGTTIVFPQAQSSSAAQ